jgi:hypothetical protein
MRHAEEFPLGMPGATLPNLPAMETVKAYASTFFHTVWLLYPVFDVEVFKAELIRLHERQHSSPGGLQETLTPGDLPALATVYLVISIGADIAAGSTTEEGDIFLHAAYGLYAYLVSMPHLWSVQALFLLCVALRGRGRDGQGWQALGQAIRIAHSIGLHRQLSGQQSSIRSAGATRPGAETGDTSRVRLDRHVRSCVWWCCYALEKMTQLETGRPSAITDHENDLRFPDPQSTAASFRYGDGHADGPSYVMSYLAKWVALARILGRISDHIYGGKRHESALALFHETGKLDQALEQWARSMPEHSRPGSDLFADEGPSNAPYHSHIASFLLLQFYQVCKTQFPLGPNADNETAL